MSIDLTISRFCTALLGRAPMVDEAILTLSGSNLMKGAMLMAMLAYCWMYFPAGPDGKARMMQNRTILCASLVASCAGEIFALMLSKLAPFRLRPLLDPALAMPVPQRLRAIAPTLLDQSSYPSDHALLFVAMATGLWLVHRRVGVAAFA